MIAFVGDLSVSDAKLLAALAAVSPRILEFGVGGSTQIFAQCQPDTLVSVDTDSGWIERTKDNLARIPHDRWTMPDFRLFDEPHAGEFDLIFVDGAPDKRLEFALAAWPHLSVNGHMIFHDTRRFEYFKEAAWVMQAKFAEVRNVTVNPQESNLTFIGKGEPLQYENWNYAEGKPLWAYGAEPMPVGADLWPMS